MAEHPQLSEGLLRQRRNAVLIGVGLSAYYLAGGHPDPDQEGVWGPLFLQFDRPWVLVGIAWLIWLYFLWRFWIYSKAEPTNLLYRDFYKRLVHVRGFAFQLLEMAPSDNFISAWNLQNHTKKFSSLNKSKNQASLFDLQNNPASRNADLGRFRLTLKGLLVLPNDNSEIYINLLDSRFRFYTVRPLFQAIRKDSGFSDIVLPWFVSAILPLLSCLVDVWFGFFAVCK